MIIEHALLKVTPGEEPRFEAALGEALAVIESAEECFGAEVRRQVEDPAMYLLLVRWGSVGAHQRFRESPRFVEWRTLTVPYYQELPTVTHYREPVER